MNASRLRGGADAWCPGEVGIAPRQSLRTSRRRGCLYVAARSSPDFARSEILRNAVAGGLSLSLCSPASAGDTVRDAAGVEGIQRQPKIVQLRTWSDCELAVSIYPHFTYNASGGGGTGQVNGMGQNGEVEVSFDPSSLLVPSLNLATTKVGGIPMPPPLNIDIHPRLLQGYINRSTGDAQFQFEAMFNFSASSLYQASPLVVQCPLSTGHAEGAIFSATGEKLDSYGRGKLVGVARVSKTDDEFVNRFLMLPTDCLAVLSAQFSFA